MAEYTFAQAFADAFGQARERNLQQQAQRSLDEYRARQIQMQQAQLAEQIRAARAAESFRQSQLGENRRQFDASMRQRRSEFGESVRQANRDFILRRDDILADNARADMTAEAQARHFEALAGMMDFKREMEQRKIDLLNAQAKALLGAGEPMEEPPTIENPPSVLESIGDSAWNLFGWINYMINPLEYGPKVFDTAATMLGVEGLPNKTGSELITERFTEARLGESRRKNTLVYDTASRNADAAFERLQEITSGLDASQRIQVLKSDPSAMGLVAAIGQTHEDRATPKDKLEAWRAIFYGKLGRLGFSRPEVDALVSQYLNPTAAPNAPSE